MEDEKKEVKKTTFKTKLPNWVVIIVIGLVLIFSIFLTFQFSTSKLYYIKLPDKTLLGKGCEVSKNPSDSIPILQCEKYFQEVG
jgi:hypothetical protein